MKKSSLKRGTVIVLFIVLILTTYHFITTTTQTTESLTTTTSSTSQSLTLANLTETETTTVTYVQATADEVTLYKEASSSSKKLAEINTGEFATWQKTTGNYYQVLTNDGQTGYLAKNKSTLVKTKKQTPPTDLKDAVIVLNPGHGGDDTGAISTDETIYEKDLTLETAEVVKKALEAQGATVILTRTDDESESLAEITEKSNQNQADIFISFHYDSTEYANEATGTTTYYYYQEYKNLAETINDSLVENLTLENRGLEYGNFQVLRENTQPALLLELGYMNNDYDLATFSTTSYQQAVATAIVAGLTDYFS